MNIQKLKAKRVENGYTQVTIAKKIGITSTTYFNKESASVPFNNIEMVKLKEVLNLTMKDIEEIFF